MIITADPQTVAAGKGQISLNITLPDGYALNDTAPFIADWSSDGAAVQIADANKKQSIVQPQLPVQVPVTLTEGTANLTGDLTIYYCEEVKKSLCFIDRVTVSVPVTVSSSATGTQIQIARTINPPQVPVGNAISSGS